MMIWKMILDKVWLCMLKLVNLIKRRGLGLIGILIGICWSRDWIDFIFVYICILLSIYLTFYCICVCVQIDIIYESIFIFILFCLYSYFIFISVFYQTEIILYYFIYWIFLHFLIFNLAASPRAKMLGYHNFLIVINSC